MQRDLTMNLVDNFSNDWQSKTGGSGIGLNNEFNWIHFSIRLTIETKNDAKRFTNEFKYQLLVLLEKFNGLIHVFNWQLKWLATKTGGNATEFDNEFNWKISHLTDNQNRRRCWEIQLRIKITDGQNNRKIIDNWNDWQLKQETMLRDLTMNLTIVQKTENQN